MNRIRYTLILLIAGMALAGCVPLVAGTAAGVAGSGTYLYMQGELKTDYYYPFDKVWAACEKTIADMRGYDVEPHKDAGEGKIDAMIENEKVHFSIKPKGRDATGKDITTVGIRVGLAGNEMSSKLIHDKLAENLVMN
ncbi:MAG TPA: DUF3568 family protein [Syntrophales bacterium]|nr:DUF3568 family protein [Syntrophales bacterium]HOX93854.1 DUF3568 family protein [Syntrophales bacterium]HPI56438.1 DUF3568 family protein [Syntrophales bacterium]HPN24174.1 DUF3568 family protein [Syntrophales bacterium]HQM28527.1 DUF3568 family protein [Syntrophales bacterium]